MKLPTFIICATGVIWISFFPLKTPILNSKPIMTNSVVAADVKLQNITNVVPLKTDVTISWIGTDSILIQGATNLLNPVWFDVTNAIASDTNFLRSCVVPMVYKNEFFRGRGKTTFILDYTNTFPEITNNSLYSFKVYAGTNSFSYIDTNQPPNYLTETNFLAGTTNYTVGTNRIVTLDTLNAPKVYYVITSIVTDGSNFVESVYSEEIIKTNELIFLSIK